MAFGSATAPYNFIPLENKIVPACEDASALYSGVITCSLETVTPLFVGGPSNRDKNDKSPREFLRINDKPAIPGTTFKGMLRSVVEILSNSSMSKVSDAPIPFRRVTGANKKTDTKSGIYKQNFPEGVIKGGYLQKVGASYYLTPCKVTPVSLSETGEDVFVTGDMKNKKHNYRFDPFDPKASRKEVSDKVMDAFLSQMDNSTYQQELWEKAKQNFKEKKPFKVFYTTIQNSSEINYIGLARYFRISYKYTVADLTPSKNNDFAKELFGRIIEGENGSEGYKGKVSCSTAFFDKPKFDSVKTYVLGEPHATCLLHYLEQDGAKDQGNEPDTLSDYNDAYAKLRGRKYYWHRDPIDPDTDSDKDNVKTRIIPLSRGNKTTFKVYLDKVNITELGAVIEALSLPQDDPKHRHFHKLGGAKSAGLGTVNIRILSCSIDDTSKRYASLEDRLEGKNTAALSEDELKQAKGAFRKYVGDYLGKEYEALDNVDAFMMMTDYDGRPDSKATANMGLDKGTPNFSKSKALLPHAWEVYKDANS